MPVYSPSSTSVHLCFSPIKTSVRNFLCTNNERTLESRPRDVVKTDKTVLRKCLLTEIFLDIAPVSNQRYS